MTTTTIPSRVQFLHACDPFHARNTGDVWSAPYRHFTFDSIERFSSRTAGRIDKTKPLIVGGGGLFGEPGEKQFLDAIAKHQGPLVVWGAGMNHFHRGAEDVCPKLRGLVGVRDAFQEYGYAPCVSCMHPAFRRKYLVKHKAVVFEGTKSLRSLGLATVHCMDAKPIEDVIEWLASAEVVITSSYHGALWATWLERKVVVVPAERCSKFYFSPHRWKISEEVPSLVQAMELADRCLGSLEYDTLRTQRFFKEVQHAL